MKFSIKGYELANSAYRGLLYDKKMPNLPENEEWSWFFTKRENGEVELVFESFAKKNKPKMKTEEVKPEKKKKEYQAGDWMKE